MSSQKNILYAVLNWGLGHATRSLPVIHQLQSRGHRIIVASDGNALEFLRQELADLVEYLELPGYNIKYPKNGKFVWSMAQQLPRILRVIKEEKQRVAQLVDNSILDGIVSDGRYGCRSDLIPSVLINHQLRLKSPILENVVGKLNEGFMSDFTETWVPDFANAPGLAGELSHYEKPWPQLRYIGPLSRFNSGDSTQRAASHKIVAILSGPEPQRTILEEELLPLLLDLDAPAVLVRGIPSDASKSTQGQIEIYGHLQSNQMRQVLDQSEIVICRSGYTSIMDLYFLEKPAIYIPTPGQTEQEYLAELHHTLGTAVIQKQGEVNIKLGIQQIQKLTRSDQRTELNSLENAIEIFEGIMA